MLVQIGEKQWVNPEDIVYMWVDDGNAALFLRGIHKTGDEPLWCGWSIEKVVEQLNGKR
jgi:hypothetical protein